MRYYSTQRPVMPGTFPRQDGRETITNFFGGKIFCEEIGREAWGYIDYPEPITEKQAKDHELVRAGSTGEVVECDKPEPYAVLVEGEQNGI